MKKDTKIISGFPGIGKTWLSKNSGEMIVLDSDVSNFIWKDKIKKIPNSKWLEDYVEHVKNNLGVADIILISTHKEIQDTLTDEGIDVVIVYPDIKIKREYIQRYINRGSSKSSVKFLKDNYTDWVKGLTEQKSCQHIVLKKDQYLSDVLSQILN